MKMRCSICGAVLSSVSSDAKQTIRDAKSRGWKKRQSDGQPVCGECVCGGGVRAAKPETVKRDIVTDETAVSNPAEEKSCSDCLHYSHSDYCSGLSVCEEWRANQKAKGAEYWPTRDDMQRKRYGEFFT
jgi:hypothetical protein